MARYKKGKRGTIYNKYGVKITKKEQEEIRKLVDEVNKIRKNLEKDFPKLDKIYENLGMENPMNIARRSKNLNQFANKGLLEAWKKQAKAIIKNPKKYITKKQRQFQKNYVEALLNNYRFSEDEVFKETLENIPDSVKSMIYEILEDSPDSFYQKYLDGYYPEFSENYIPQVSYEDNVSEIYMYEGDYDEKGNLIVQNKDGKDVVLTDELLDTLYTKKFEGLN